MNKENKMKEYILKKLGITETVSQLIKKSELEKRYLEDRLWRLENKLPHKVGVLIDGNTFLSEMAQREKISDVYKLKHLDDKPYYISNIDFISEMRSSCYTRYSNKRRVRCWSVTLTEAEGYETIKIEIGEIK